MFPPSLARPPTYNVTVPRGAAARLPCTVTNVEHQAVSPVEWILLYIVL